MVGIEWEADPVAGVIYFPALDEIVLAARGTGCWSSRAGEPLKQVRVGSKSRLSDCTLLVTEVNSFSKVGALPAYLKLDKSARIARSWGDCYGYYLVAREKRTS
jgi:fructose-1,6-bisphosphatase/inositol monophosphatase family enzyme